MKHGLKLKPFNSQGASANVVDGKLILSFPQALTPVVWQMDLTQAKASALEVLDVPGKNYFSLVLKTPRGEDTAIAQFETKPQAVEALMAVARALESAHGQIRPFTSAENSQMEVTSYRGAQQRPHGAGKWIAGILGILLLLVLINIWGSLLPRESRMTSGSTNESRTLPGPAAAAGEAVSADDFLKGQQ